jgi:RNA-directed DNA polymerase
MSKGGKVDSSFSERPGHYRPRRLADWLNPTGARKVHSLIDKVYKRKNLEIAWDRVRANQGAGGVDGESIEAFGEKLEERLTRLQDELRTGSYTPRHPDDLRSGVSAGTAEPTGTDFRTGVR